MFRNSKYVHVERYEDVVFLTRNQKKDGHRFVVDNTGEVTPFDWYNARFVVDFQSSISS